MPPHTDPGWFLVVWLTVIGGVIGSFLNVVVYRVPLGLSLIEPPSHCPRCKQPIRWYDNVPVFGWIILRGRCRFCGQPISIRYPLVEAFTAAMFGALAAVEHFSHGANLPERTIHLTGSVTLSGLSGMQLYGVYLFHLLLLCTLLCAALIEYDGRRPPLRLFVPALAVGAIAPSIWPMLRPVAAWPGEPGSLAGAIDCLAGLAAGAALGGAAWWFGSFVARRQKGRFRFRKEKVASPGDVSHDRKTGTIPRLHPAGLFLCLICAGLYLGWQAVAALAVATAVVHLLLLPPRRAWSALWAPASLWLLLLTFGWILFWSRLVPL